MPLVVSILILGTANLKRALQTIEKAAITTDLLLEQVEEQDIMAEAREITERVPASTSEETVKATITTLKTMDPTKSKVIMTTDDKVTVQKTKETMKTITEVDTRPATTVKAKLKKTSGTMWITRPENLNLGGSSREKYLKLRKILPRRCLTQMTYRWILNINLHPTVEVSKT
jgi:hypothetical protein